MTEDFEYLDTDDLLDLARRLLGDPPPIRDIGLLGAAAARPQTTAFGEDAYPDVWAKAAVLLHSVVWNHPPVDGNRRLGWLATAAFLELNGASVADAGNAAVLRPRNGCRHRQHERGRGRSHRPLTGPWRWYSDVGVLDGSICTLVLSARVEYPQRSARASVLIGV